METRNRFRMLTIVFAVIMLFAGITTKTFAQEICGSNTLGPLGNDNQYIFLGNQWNGSFTYVDQCLQVTNSTTPPPTSLSGIGAGPSSDYISGTFDDTTGTPSDYPDFLYGLFQGTSTSNTQLPMAVTKITGRSPAFDVLSGENVVEPSNYNNDMAYDIWFNTYAGTPSGQNTTGTELMIWVQHNGGAGTISGGPSYSFTDSTGQNWTAYTGTNTGNCNGCIGTGSQVISFVRNNSDGPTPTGGLTEKLNLDDFFTEALNVGEIQSSWYLTAVEFGTEVWVGGPGLQVNNFWVNVVPNTTTEGPYGGTPAAVPGTVQAENYDTGGQGVGYNVTSVNGTGNAYRSDGVDLEATTDTGGGYDLGWTAAGQWTRYTVNVATAGTYTVSFRVASPTAVTDGFHLSNSLGTNLSGNVNVPATGGYQTWTTVMATVTLPAGQQVLTLNQDTAGGNINWFALAPSGGGGGTSGLVDINCGGAATGSWIADTDFVGGTADVVTNTISTTAVTSPAPEAVYRSNRYGAVTYTIGGLMAGTSYTVRLHFAETYWTAAGDREFNVSINGTQVLTDFDIFKTAGGENIANIQQFTLPANSSGQIVITSANVVDNAQFNGIEIDSTSGGGSAPAAPAAPTGLTATSGNAQITLAWTASGGATSYNVYRAGSSGGEGGTPIATGITSTSYTNTGLTNGTAYFYKVAAVNAIGTSAQSNEASATPKAPTGGEGPYGGTPAAIPGTVQAENYDTGGQGVGYNVTSVNGTGNAYRSDGVDLEATTDTGGGYDLGWSATAQWFRYSVNVATAGTYTVSFRVASPTAVTDGFHLSNATGTNLSGNINVPATGAYQTWATVTANVTLPAGQQVLTLNDDAAGWNLNYMTFASAGLTPVLQIDCGGAAAGTWVADADFAGGTVVTTTNTIDTTAVTNPAPVAVYQSNRYNAPTYTIGGLTANAAYTVRLHFAETYWTAAGKREFNVSMNGTQVLTNFDIYATAGAANKANVQQFTTTANGSGQIVIAESNVVDNAQINGIEIEH